MFLVQYVNKFQIRIVDLIVSMIFMIVSIIFKGIQFATGFFPIDVFVLRARVAKIATARAVGIATHEPTTSRVVVHGAVRLSDAFQEQAWPQPDLGCGVNHVRTRIPALFLCREALTQVSA